MILVAKERLDSVPFALPQQAIVDEHAVQPIADRLVDHHGRHRGIHSPGKSENDLPVRSDLLGDLLDLLLCDIAGLPTVGTPGDAQDEVAQHRDAVIRVPDFGVELQTVEPALGIGGSCHRTRLAARQHFESLR